MSIDKGYVSLQLDGVHSLIDYEVKIEDGEFSFWKKKVPKVDIDPQKVTDADLIITTVDTLRHQEVLCSWLSEHRPFLLCGPPGSGKTMTLMSTLKALPDFDMIFVNFSSSTTPKLILQQFEHYCEYYKSSKGYVLRPRNPNKWLILFCDEINLPDTDKYGTQSIITFLRQLTEQKGFWRPSDKQWIVLERLQFVGACNPPTDVGRHPLSDRFLRHCPLILVDFPGSESLRQIYGTFNRAMLKKVPSLRNSSDNLTDAMVEFYERSQIRFTADMQPHYIYSPRELTRWKFAINEAIESIETLEQLVRLWAHEALRLFQDRLVEKEEKEWCDKLVDEVASKHFLNLKPTALERPILFTTYLNKNYVSVETEELRTYIQARLKIFYEEELNTQIVVFDSVLEHILRIDRVLCQPLGHLLLVGQSGVGKTTLSRFVSWMNNLNVFQIKAGRNYSLSDFDNDLRDVMKRSGVKQEKITFIFDESNVLSVAFLERMNALLASGEVPGLFEGEEYMALINQMKDAVTKEKMMIDSDEQLYKTFTRNVQRNLHIVFTMNPANPDYSNRAGSSPALFNRCVIDWFGDWSDEALYQVAKEFTQNVDAPPESFSKSNLQNDATMRHLSIVNSIVFTHKQVVKLNSKLKKAAKKFNYLTPRDFLDFIKHFTELHVEKKSQLEEQQYHLNTGLEKLAQTEERVIEMKVSLDQYKKDLEIKEQEANTKLNMMVTEKKAAEAKKEGSIQLSAELEIKKKDVEEKSTSVNKELDEALPALQRAQESVSKIKTQHLSELKALNNPPTAVKITLEAVQSMLTGKISSGVWTDVKLLIGKADFIKSVLNFDTEKLPNKTKDAINKTYINTPEWDVDKINRASQAAGPLSQWVESQLKYADILKTVDPLRQQVKDLEKELLVLQESMSETNNLIKQLEKNIDQYQKDYALLITEVNHIKSEMNKVLEKVTRSQNLIENLSSERFRWENSSKNFKSQLATMPGDVLISGAFLAYIGFFDHFYRKVMLTNWKSYLETQGILFRQDLSLIEFLSKASDRLVWQGHGLPNDDLCSENSIILQKFHRYPLIIDPSGQALNFILSYYKEKKISRSSFSDEGFMKNLETALRFGCPLLVQDVDKVDPILNSVLNKELTKTGGRVLIRVGDQEIDFSPQFNLFMITRDSNARFTPDLCSRVTFINFTVTPSSLQNQCLNIYLRNERPDVEEKRLNLLKLQGEYVVKLRELEDSLLDALSKSTGNILDNEQAINTLETLKKESGIVMEQIESSGKVMEEVQLVTNQYIELSEASSKIFFTLLSLSTVHYLYEFSLQFYMDTIYQLLTTNEELKSLTQQSSQVQNQRLEIITNELFRVINSRISPSLLTEHKLIFTLRLAQIKLGKVFQSDFQQLLKSPSIIVTKISKDLLKKRLNNFQLVLLDELKENQRYESLVNNLQKNESQWLTFLDSDNPLQDMPTGWVNQGHEQQIQQEISNHKYIQASNMIRDLTIIRTLRPDKFVNCSNTLVDYVLGKNFMQEVPIDLQKIVDVDSKPQSPILFCSAAGFDPSFKIDALAKLLNKKYTAVAIGSAEGFEIAEKAINQASKSGQWVVLKNVHLAPQWLMEFEKKIHRLINPHSNFRVFLTMEFNPKVPSTLIRQSYKVVFEPPDGIKASLTRTYKTVISPERGERAPFERAKLHFLLAWLHAVVQERLRYQPIGWSKSYEFNEADQRCALDLIDEYIDNMGQRSNVPIDKIPWKAFCSILCNNLYGGKIDNEYDQKILASLVEQFFNKQSFEANQPLFQDKNPLLIPDGIRTEQYVEWIEKLPSQESPTWAGLPSNVERLLKESKANKMIETLWELQDFNEEEVTLDDPKEKVDNQQSNQVAWLRQLGERATNYLQILPQQMQRPERTSTSISDPLFRFLEREIQVCGNLLDTVRKNLQEIVEMSQGKGHSTNQTKQLAKDLHNDIIPSQWKKYVTMKITINEWMLDFKKRIEQFAQLIKYRDYQKKGLWLGGLLFPEAYMTATRQFVAQNNKWSLEELVLQMNIHDGKDIDNDTFLIFGTQMEGADWNGKNNELQINDAISVNLPTLSCKWIKMNKVEQKAPLQINEIMVPVYLNKSRANLLFSVKLNKGSIDKSLLYQKGVAIISWNL